VNTRDLLSDVALCLFLLVVKSASAFAVLYIIRYLVTGIIFVRLFIHIYIMPSIPLLRTEKQNLIFQHMSYQVIIIHFPFGTPGLPPNPHRIWFATWI